MEESPSPPLTGAPETYRAVADLAGNILDINTEIIELHLDYRYITFINGGNRRVCKDRHVTQ